MLVFLSLLLTAPVYVQASTVRLREAPSAKAALVAEVAIASQCTQLAAASGEWAQYQCGELKGHAKTEFFAVEAPNLQLLVSKALNDELPNADEQMQAMNRAIALASRGKGSEELAGLWEKYRALFVKVELQRLRGARETRTKVPKMKAVKTKCYMGTNDCAKQLKQGADVFFVQMEEQDFVFAGLQANGQLVVTSGSFADEPFDGGQVDGHKVSYQFEQTYTSSPDPMTLQALFFNLDFAQVAGCEWAVHTTHESGCALDAKYGACSECQIACFKTCSACRVANVSDANCTAPLRACRKACNQ